MSLFDHIDIYCERTDASFWSEPVNAITNIAFVIAGLALARKYRALPHNRQSLMLQLLIVNVIVIGLGSFTFHTVATGWAMMADNIPIIIFIYLAFAIYLRDVFHYTVAKMIAALLSYAAASYLLFQIISPSAFNHSAGYIPAILLMFILAFFTFKAGHKVSAQYILMAAIVFIFSITLRTLDADICDRLPVGIHFMWHILNAVVLFYITYGIISHQRWLAEKDGVLEAKECS